MEGWCVVRENFIIKMQYSKSDCRDSPVEEVHCCFTVCSLGCPKVVQVPLIRHIHCGELWARSGAGLSL